MSDRSLTIREWVDLSISARQVDHKLVEIMMNRAHADELIATLRDLRPDEFRNTYPAATPAPVGWIARYRNVWIVVDDSQKRPLPKFAWWPA